MARPVSKATENVYYQYRKEAAKYNDSFNSREKAAEYIGVSRDSLADYELGLCKVVPVDKVILMADAYNAPELLNHYCINECPIGCRAVQPLELRSIDRLGIVAINDLENADDMKKLLLKIVADGVIDEHEKPDLKRVVEYFEKLERTAGELKLWVEKHLG